MKPSAVIYDPAKLPREMALMVDIFCACIETGIFPKPLSRCHRKARDLVDRSGYRFERERMEMNIENGKKGE